LDAITSVPALNKLQSLNQDIDAFDAKVFHNDVSDLFHPKISHFELVDGGHILVVGSGNFTLSGLQTNIEAYSVACGSSEELTSIIAWDSFLELHKERIKDIDESAFEKARQNVWRGTRKPRVSDEEIEIEADDQLDQEEIDLEEIIGADEVDTGVEEELEIENLRVLIAQVPAAGGRWKQIHYNAAVIEQFFRGRANSHQRIFLQEVNLEGEFGENEARPIIFSTSNSNYKIEISGRPGVEYPNTNKPIIILKEIGTRNFLYMLIMPGDDHFDDLWQFTETEESVGRGLPRILTNSNRLAELWPDCPIL